MPTAGVAARSPSASRSLHRVADEFAAARGELMGAMLAEGGKTLAESDPEVSEAIDFCRFYADSAQYFSRVARTDGAAARAWSSSSRRGIFRWRFRAAAWRRRWRRATRVILKPASDTVLIAYLLCQCFWRAGVPQTALAIRAVQRRHGRRSSSWRTTASTR